MGFSLYDFSIISHEFTFLDLDSYDDNFMFVFSTHIFFYLVMLMGDILSSFRLAKIEYYDRPTRLSVCYFY